EAVAKRPVVDENRIRSLGMDETADLQSRDRGGQSQESPGNRQQRYGARADQDYPGGYQRTDNPSADYDRQAAPGGSPSQGRKPRGYNPPASSGSSAVFAGGTNSSSNSSVTRSGPLTRPRSQTDSSENSSGLGVRIIPSDSTLSSAPDPRYSS